MMNIEELRKIFCEDGLYAVCVENGNLVSHYRIMCLRKNGAALINFVDGRVTDGFILREGVTNGAIVIHTQRLKSDPGGNLLS